MTKMIEKRNERFTQAVNELLVACEVQVRVYLWKSDWAHHNFQQDQDAMELLSAATHDHLPVKPELAVGQKTLAARQGDLDFFLLNPDHRPSIESILNDIQDEEFYEEQIVTGGHRIVESREAVYGTFSETPKVQQANSLTQVTLPNLCLRI